MKVQIVSVGKKPPAWVSAAWEEYAKRFIGAGEIKIELKEIKPEPRMGKTVEQIWQAEEQRITIALGRGCLIVTLDERGKAPTTLELSMLLKEWRQQGNDVALVIGGPDGLSPQWKAKSDVVLRLSNLTMPHFMVRVLLIEQLYRSHTILLGHPYHRE